MLIVGRCRMLLQRNMKILFVLVALIWRIAMVGAAWNADPAYKTITLTTNDITTGRYASFLKQIRDVLASGQTSFGIPVMRAQSDQFLLLKLANSETKFITLAMYVANAYVVGYQAGTRAYFFKDIPTDQSNNLFKDIQGNNRIKLSFKGNYIDLERFAKAGRTDTPLGFTPLKTAITDMYSWQSGSQQKMASGFLVCIQMFAEAARMEYIARLTAVAKGFKPGNDITTYENRWSDLSSRIQTANPTTGKFTEQAVELIDAKGNKYTVDSVTPQLQEDLSLLLYPKTSQFSHPAITSVVPNGKNMFVPIQIVGAPGMCLLANVIRGGAWMETCDGGAIEQQWAIYADGSIRPRQNQTQCLACKYDDTKGCLFQIHSCTGSLSEQRWVLKNDGIMFNLHNGLVTAVSDSNTRSLHQIVVWPSIGTPNQLKWVA